MEFEIEKVFKNGLELPIGERIGGPQNFQFFAVNQHDDVCVAQGDCCGCCFINCHKLSDFIMHQPGALAAN